MGRYGRSLWLFFGGNLGSIQMFEFTATLQLSSSTEEVFRARIRAQYTTNAK